MGKRHKPEEIIGKLREAEIVLARGGTTADACRRIAVTEQTYYRWRKEYGGLQTDQARRMKDLAKENLRLRRALSARKRVEAGNSGSGRVCPGGGRYITKQNTTNQT